VSTVPVRGIELSCSAGVATYPDDAEDASNLCQLAEGALHWAKRRGKGRTRRFDPGHVPLGWTRRRAGEVEELLASEQPITPVFQPVVALASGHLVGYEALARFTTSPKRSPEAWFAQAHWARTWRRRPSAPRSSRWAARLARISRSTSAPRPSPRRRSSGPFRAISAGL
jgi:predicted signal transduction protein with EAL and GGDEF domain